MYRNNFDFRQTQKNSRIEENTMGHSKLNKEGVKENITRSPHGRQQKYKNNVLDILKMQTSIVYFIISFIL